MEKKYTGTNFQGQSEKKVKTKIKPRLKAKESSRDDSCGFIHVEKEHRRYSIMLAL